MKNHKNKFVIVCTFYNISGGISSYVKGLEDVLRKKNQLQGIVSPDVKSDSSLCHIKVKGKSRAAIIFSTFLTLRKLRPRFVQCHGTWYLVVSCIIYKWYSKCVFRKVVLVAVKHTEILLESGTLKYDLLSLIDRNCDYLVFVSNRFRESHLKLNPQIKEAQSKVIWPGVGSEFVSHILTAQKKVWQTAMMRTIISLLHIWG